MWWGGGTSQIDDPQVHGFVDQLEKATCGNALRQSKGHGVRELDSFARKFRKPRSLYAKGVAFARWVTCEQTCCSASCVEDR